MADDGSYSTMEVVHPGYHPLNTNKTLPVESGKEIVTDESGKQVVTDDGAHAPEPAYANQWVGDGLKSDNPPPAYPQRSRRKWLIAAGTALFVIIILAAVLGGVLGSRHKSNNSSPSMAPTSIPSNIPSNASTSAPTHDRRNIAAVSFVSGNTNRTRVYYQDVAGQLMEAADSPDGTWTNTALGFTAMNGTALAAAVSRYDPLVHSNMPQE